MAVDPVELRQWEAHFDGLASFLTNQLGLGTSTTPVVSGRICLLGTLPTGGGMLELFLARGLTWNDAASVLERAHRLTASRGSVIIVLKQLPAPTLWSRAQPELLALSEYASWNEAQSRVDLGCLPATLKTIRPPVREEAWLTVTECAKLLMDDVSGLDLKKARARVSRAATAGKFRTNGESRVERRIDRDSFAVWRHEQRDRDLDAAD